MILLADSEGPDQTARMRRLIWAFAVRICSKTHFRMAWTTQYRTQLKKRAYFTAQSDQGLHCRCIIQIHWFSKRTTKTQISLRKRAGWSGSALIAYGERDILLCYGVYVCVKLKSFVVILIYPANQLTYSLTSFPKRCTFAVTNLSNNYFCNFLYNPFRFFNFNAIFCFHFVLFCNNIFGTTKLIVFAQNFLLIFFYTTLFRR